MKRICNWLIESDENIKKLRTINLLKDEMILD